MFFTLRDSAQEEPARVQELLDKHHPVPEQELASLCGIAARTPQGPLRYAHFRRFVIDIDDLFCDVRWAVGQALVLVRSLPELGEPVSDPEARLDSLGMPNRAALLLRPFVLGRGQIFFSDLRQHRGGGGTVAGWMLHMVVDIAVSKSIAILDRLAHLLILAVDAPAPRGRMYFRSGKFEILLKEHGLQLPQALLKLAVRDDLAFFLDYRDGLSHTVRPTTRALRMPPVDRYVDETGRELSTPPNTWSPWELTAIGLGALQFSSEALREVAQHLDSVVPQS